MADMFVVQDGWKMPPLQRAQKGARKYPVEGMTVGQMFFVEGRTPKSVSAYISRIAKNLSGTYNTRAVWAIKNDGKWVASTEGVKGAVEGTGVWRVT